MKEACKDAKAIKHLYDITKPPSARLTSPQQAKLSYNSLFTSKRTLAFYAL